MALKMRSIFRIFIITACFFLCYGLFAEKIKLKDGGVVRALKVDGGARFTRKEVDDLTEQEIIELLIEDALNM